jgi:hypothetical protein
MSTSATAKKRRNYKVATPERVLNNNIVGTIDQTGSRSGGEAQVSTATARPANNAEQQAKPAKRQNLRTSCFSERTSETPATACSRFLTTSHGYGRLASTEAADRGPANDLASSTW